MHLKQISENINRFSSNKKIYLSLALAYVLLIICRAVYNYFVHVIEFDIFETIFGFYMIISFIVFTTNYIIDRLDVFYLFYFFLFFWDFGIHPLWLAYIEESFLWLLVLFVQNYETLIEKRENEHS
jgi:hypothetical protein